MTPQQLVDRLQLNAAAPLVIDVRPRREFELCHLAGISQHVALFFLCRMAMLMLILLGVKVC